MKAYYKIKYTKESFEYNKQLEREPAYTGILSEMKLFNSLDTKTNLQFILFKM